MTVQKMPLLFGGDYNPEQWPEATWEKDMQQLQAAHINELTLNVFSWALLQPDEATYDFSMLDKIMALAKRYQMQVVLATSTGALPAWLVKKYPDAARTDSDGRHASFGMRHNACPNSPHFQKLAAALVTQLAKRYGQDPAVVCWHVSNEYGGLCYCDNCAKAFRKWLQAHYQDLAAVNQAWNSNFWSHTFHNWEEIVPPTHLSDMIDVGSDKPVLAGMALDYRRFQSDSLLANFNLEKAAIRQFDQETPITTNLMGTQKDLDYFQWAQAMDIVSWDSYPSYNTPPFETAMNHDLMYGLKQAPFMLMEQTPSQQNWQPYCALKQPGEMREQSYQAVAHGASTVQFFQLKQSQNGIEKFHGAVIAHAQANGQHTTRVYREVQQLGQELAGLPEDLLASKPQAKVGILFDWPSYWGVEYATGPSREMHYVEQVQHYYHMCYQAGLNVAMVGKDSNWQGLSILIAPVAYLLSKAATAKIEAFVHAGGTFLTTYMSGISDDHDNVWLDGYPGTMQQLLGLWTEEVDALPPDAKVQVAWQDGSLCTSSFLCSIIHPTSAKVLAKYDDSRLFYTGQPALTMNQYGQGQAFYVGTLLDTDGLSKLILQLLKSAKLAVPKSAASAGVEIAQRFSEKARYTFVLNTTDQVQAAVNPDPDAIDLLSGSKLAARLQLAPFAVAILQSAL